MGTKNNPANRGKAEEARVYKGKVVKPVLYIGKHIGHGNYMSAQYEGGEIVTNDSGEPVKWDTM